MRRSLIVAGTVIVVGASVVLAGELIAGLISLDRYRPIFEQKLSQTIGLTVEIRGDLHLSVFPLPHIEATEIVLADPARPQAPVRGRPAHPGGGDRPRHGRDGIGTGDGQPGLHLVRRPREAPGGNHGPV